MRKLCCALAVASALLGLASSVKAQAIGDTTAVTVGTSSAKALAQNAASRYLGIFNLSSTASIACSFGANSTAALNAAGSIQLPPLGGFVWDVVVPTDQLNCIASAVSTPMTIQAY